MTVSDKYFSYLEKFQKTSTVADLFHDRNQLNCIALRHDIDHSIDIALEFAYAEHKLGFKSTYFILHNHVYQQDPIFVEKLLQIQDYGHEIGLHLNVIAGWVEGFYDDPSSHLSKWLTKMRSQGLAISGCATHGDSLCYKHGFLNSWFFKDQVELGGVDVGLSAEGIPDPSNRKVIYRPQIGLVTRIDGLSLKLWSREMSEFGLDYEAVNLNAKYWSDTGRDWHRTGDPYCEDMSKGRHQVLMHPIHWLGKPRKIFLLSTAGAIDKNNLEPLQKYLGNEISQNWTLNYRQRNGKHVNEEIAKLDNERLHQNPELAKKLIQYSSRYHAKPKKDYIEFSVYLPDFVDQLRESFPDAEIYGLIAEGKCDIISMINQGSFASPEGIGHPYLPVLKGANYSQFQKTCVYWNEVNSKLIEQADNVVKIEETFLSVTGLAKLLEALDIPVHKRVLEFCAPQGEASYVLTPQQKANEWCHEDNATYNLICGDTLSSLDYPALRYSMIEKRLINLNKSIGRWLFIERRNAKLLNYLEPVVSKQDLLLKYEHSKAICHDEIADVNRFDINISESGRIFFTLDFPAADVSNRCSAAFFQITAKIKFRLIGDACVKVLMRCHVLDGTNNFSDNYLTVLSPGWCGKICHVVQQNLNKKYEFIIEFSEVSKSTTIYLDSFCLNAQRIRPDYFFRISNAASD